MTTSGSSIDEVTQGDQDSGTKSVHDTEYSTLSAGTLSFQDVTTSTTTETGFYSESDASSSFGNAYTNNSTLTVVAGGPTGPTGSITVTGGPVASLTGAQSPALAGAAEAAAIDGGARGFMSVPPAPRTMRPVTHRMMGTRTRHLRRRTS